MKLPITIDGYKITRDRDHRGMVALRGRDCTGSLEPDKLLEDLPRVIGRSLTIDEQVALTLAVPGLVA